MIIPSEGNKVEMGGVMTAPTEFKIANSAHAFSILSQGLYSDKIGAVVREIISNAYDAHVKAGCPDKVIEIHLPTSLEPVFSVKDEGIGLSDESMVELYTTYFASTKQNNDEIGGFGLGCKSPFAYTKTFTVVSIYEGMMRTYSAMVNEDGVPVITMLDEEPTTQHNGITVSMPVRNYDMTEFRTKTAKVLEFFPHFKSNLTEFKASKTAYTHQGPGWGIRDTKKDEHLHHTDPRAIVGKVAYGFNLDKANLTEEDKAILKLPIDLFFAIGDLDVTPSRESLSLNKRTTANLIDRLHEIQDSILDSLRQEIASAKSLWFAKLALKDRLSTYSPYRVLVQKVIKQHFAQYVGMVMNDVSTEVALKTYGHLTIMCRRYNNRKSKMEKTVNLQAEVYRSNVSIETSENVYFYMNDSKAFYPKTTKRILEMLQEEHPGKDFTLYFIQPTSDNYEELAKEFSKLVDELGVPDIEFVSDLPPVPKKPRAPRAPSDTCKFAWQYLECNNGRLSDNWRKLSHEDLEGDGPFFYVPLDHLEVTYPGLDNNSLMTIWRAMKRVGLEIETDDDTYLLDRNSTLYGVNAKGLERIKDNSNWVNIFDAMKANPLDIPKEYRSYLASRETRVTFNDLPEVFRLYADDDMNTLRKFVKGTNFHRQAVMVKRVKQLEGRANRRTDMFTYWEALLDFCGQKVDVKKAVPDSITKLVSHIDIAGMKAKYPMLNVIESRYWQRNDETFCKTLGQYIHQMDTL